MAYDNNHLTRIKDLESLMNTFELRELHEIYSALGLYIDSDGDLAQKDND